MENLRFTVISFNVSYDVTDHSLRHPFLLIYVAKNMPSLCLFSHLTPFITYFQQVVFSSVLL